MSGDPIRDYYDHLADMKLYTGRHYSLTALGGLGSMYETNTGDWFYAPPFSKLSAAVNELACGVGDTIAAMEAHRDWLETKIDQIRANNG
jgi:hypothetical protein